MVVRAWPSARWWPASSAAACPRVGLVGVGLGVWSLVYRPRNGRALAIAGIAAGSAGFILTSCLLGLFLPALAKARSTARMVKSGIQMRELARALNDRDESLEALGKDGNLKAGDNLESILADRGVTELFVSPRGEPSAPGYLYVFLPDEDCFDPETPLLIEDPELNADPLHMVYGDGTLDTLPRADFHAMVRSILDSGGRLFHTDGRAWDPGQERDSQSLP